MAVLDRVQNKSSSLFYFFYPSHLPLLFCEKQMNLCKTPHSRRTSSKMSLGHQLLKLSCATLIK